MQFIEGTTTEYIGKCISQRLIVPITIFFLLSAGMVSAQNYTTTGLSTDWNNAKAWTCSGGSCANKPIPDRRVSNSNITINHTIFYNSNNPISLDNKATLTIGNNAKLTTISNINISAGSSLTVNQGQIEIGPGVLNNLGTITLTNALMFKNGNIVNDGQIIVSNACVELINGNFVNNNTISGVGSVKTLNGNINNFGIWGIDIIYFFSQNGSGLPGSLSTLEQVTKICECILTNCDILPGYPPNSKVNEIIGSALTSLVLNYNANEGYNDLIYTINPNNQVLIEIVILDEQFISVSAFLNTFGIDPDTYISDVFKTEDDERIITVFFPISDLQALNARSDIINQVYEVSPPIPNQGLITSQGDAAQNSNLARLGWKISGVGVKVGVISDSYDRKSGVQEQTSLAVQNDIDNGDLPGVENAVTVVEDFPYGIASDEGRAMMQIVHDVAPDAKLFFRTGFISEGNMAAGISELVNLGCDIIVDDITYMKAPFYRDGIIADAINAATTSSGVSYFSSAGNFGSRSYESTFNASSSNPIRHDFGGNDVLQNITLGVGQYIIALQWDDDFYSLGSSTGAVNDMDIYLAGDNGTILYGFNRNNLGADPVEIMPFTVI
ncbi:MAG: hypothetical protein ACJAVA_002295, partial [Flavobacteriaceae bacterium]